VLCSTGKKIPVANEIMTKKAGDGSAKKMGFKTGILGQI
jgi:hypothetical protein